MEDKGDIKKTDPSHDSETAGELKRVRSRNKVLKVAAIVFSALFVFLFCVVMFIYHRIAGLKDLFPPLAETSQDSVFRVGEDGNSGGPLRAFKGLASSTHGPASSLTVFTNAEEYVSQAGGITSEDSENASRVFAKYADRPIVKDFVSELKKDPDFVQALKEKGANDPLAMIASIRKTKSMQVLAAKFVMRRDFMPFMMEVMGDPDLQALLNKMPMGNMGPMSQMLKMMPSAAQPRSGIPARAMDGSRPEEYAAPDQNYGESPRLDTSAITAPSESTGTPLKKKTPPPPADQLR
ncbi:MAG: hypothetical protein A2218_10195 [Elusimicrobia bacterium RIFOXYA2_FULL_53_38]|nr:MAG: hypothetical protein A2218_10195 [Elusimicrobia bacterium RIFOXYA2_FULL_53_38]